MLAAAFLVLALSMSGVDAQQVSVVGSWKLVSYDTTTPQGVTTYPLGEDAVGLLIYLPSGRMSVQFMRPNPAKFASGDAWRGTLEEERAAFRGFFGYAGRYTLDPKHGSVTHHIEISSIPDYVGTNVMRTFTMTGNRITLRTPQRAMAGQTSTSTLIWERVD